MLELLFYQSYLAAMLDCSMCFSPWSWTKWGDFLLMSFNLAYLRGTVGIYATVKGVSMLDNCYLQVHTVKNSEFKLKIRIALADGSGFICMDSLPCCSGNMRGEVLVGTWWKFFDLKQGRWCIWNFCTKQSFYRDIYADKYAVKSQGSRHFVSSQYVSLTCHYSCILKLCIF